MRVNAQQPNVYAYDAHFPECALSLRLPLLTLDRSMKHIARKLSIPLVQYSR